MRIIDDKRILCCMMLLGFMAFAKYSSAMEADRYVLRASYYENRGQYDLAIVVYNEAIKFYLNEPVYFYNCAILYEKKEQPTKAILDYKEAIRLDPNAINGKAIGNL